MKPNIQGFLMRYDDVGSGPAIVILHGELMHWGGGKKSIRSLVQSGFRLVIIQFPERSKTGSSFGIGELVRFLDYLGIGRAVFFADSAHQGLLDALLGQYPWRVAACDNTRGGDHPDSMDQRLLHFLSSSCQETTSKERGRRSRQCSKILSRASGRQ